MALFKDYLRTYSGSIIVSRKLNKDYHHHDSLIILLKLIVKQHMKILDIVSRIDSVYSYVSLFQILFSNVIICVTGYVLITVIKKLIASLTEKSKLILLFNRSHIILGCQLDRHVVLDKVCNVHSRDVLASFHFLFRWTISTKQGQESDNCNFQIRRNFSHCRLNYLFMQYMTVSGMMLVQRKFEYCLWYFWKLKLL